MTCNCSCHLKGTACCDHCMIKQEISLEERLTEKVVVILATKGSNAYYTIQSLKGLVMEELVLQKKQSLAALREKVNKLGRIRGEHNGEYCLAFDEKDILSLLQDKELKDIDKKQQEYLEKIENTPELLDVFKRLADE